MLLGCPVSLGGLRPSLPVRKEPTSCRFLRLPFQRTLAIGSAKFSQRGMGSSKCPEDVVEAISAEPETFKLQDQLKSHLTTGKDLLIFGPGVLGRLVAQSWMKENPGCRVTGLTNTMTHHDELWSLGIIPMVKDVQIEDCFPYVIFCAPASSSEDYATEVRIASQRWNGEGVFIFTSSTAVYDCIDNSICDEDAPIVPLGRSPRVDAILRAEAEALKAGGTIVRLAGLYTLDRGPHVYWMKKQKVDARPDHILNLIHYEDAASLCITILKKGVHGSVFMGCDDCPLSRQEVMDITDKTGKFKGFTGVEGPLGKRLDNSKTRFELEWQPKYRSFEEFVALS